MTGAVDEHDVESLRSAVASLACDFRVFVVQEESYKLLVARVDDAYFDVYQRHDGWACSGTEKTYYGITPGEAFKAMWTAEYRDSHQISRYEEFS